MTLTVTPSHAYPQYVAFAFAPAGWSLAAVAADTVRWRYLLDRLPKCTFAESARWRRELARSFDDLVEDLDAGQLPRPRTIAEQLALLIVIAQASAALADEGYGDWDAVTDVPMGDRDVEVFYHPATAASGLRVFHVKRGSRPGTNTSHVTLGGGFDGRRLGSSHTRRDLHCAAGGVSHCSCHPRRDRKSVV